MPAYLYMHTAGGIITLYMLLIGVRWFAPYLELDLSHGPRLWVGRAVDPLIELARKLLGQNTGPFDWAPVVALLGVWLVRKILVGF